MDESKALRSQMTVIKKETKQFLCKTYNYSQALVWRDGFDLSMIRPLFLDGIHQINDEAFLKWTDNMGIHAQTVTAKVFTHHIFEVPNLVRLSFGRNILIITMRNFSFGQLQNHASSFDAEAYGSISLASVFQIGDRK